MDDFRVVKVASDLMESMLHLYNIELSEKEKEQYIKASANRIWNIFKNRRSTDLSPKEAATETIDEVIDNLEAIFQQS